MIFDAYLLTFELRWPVVLVLRVLPGGTLLRDTTSVVLVLWVDFLLAVAAMVATEE